MEILNLKEKNWYNSRDVVDKPSIFYVPTLEMFGGGNMDFNLMVSLASLALTCVSLLDSFEIDVKIKKK